MQGYPPQQAPMMQPPPMRRLPPPPPQPMYYDYGYGYDQGYDPYYGGGYAYPPQPMAPPPMQPRMSRYDAYMEEDPELVMAGAGQMAPGPRQSARPRTPPQVPTPIKGRGDLPPTSMAEFDQRESEAQAQKKQPYVPAHNRDLVPKEPHSRPHLTQEAPESEGERHLAKMAARYPSYSEPQMLQDHVDKMRIRLKSLAYSLDPTGPVPEIVIPERVGAKTSALELSSEDSKKKHTLALEYKEMPNLSTRRAIRTYPEDEVMKDNLRIKCLSHYKTTRTAADSELRNPALPESYASKYANKYQTKWEEPDTIYGSSSDKKPFSKPMAEICPAPEPTVERKKSKSKKKQEEPAALEAPPAPSAPAAEEPVSCVSESAPAEGEPYDPEADEKEKKKLEKKKRKAEREAAAKAAMEAELAALAAAEAELARLEQESASLATPAAAPAEEPAAPLPVEIPTVEVQSEFAADKCESSNVNGDIMGVSVSSEEPPQQVTVQVVPEPVVTEELPQVVEPPTPVLVAPPPPPEPEEQQPAVDSTAAAETSQ